MRNRVQFKPIRQVQKTLKDTALRLLTEKILSGEIRPGERLNESQLARQFHISRAPIREALQQLLEQGLVVNVIRRGMFVVELQDEDIQKINKVRIVLEAEAFRLARDSMTPEGMQKLTTIVQAIEEDRLKQIRTAESIQIDI